MADLIDKVPMWIQAIALILSSLVVIATAVARLTPSTKDDEAVSKIKKVLDKIIAWLPTIGINPHTKELQKKVDEQKK